MQNEGSPNIILSKRVALSVRLYVAVRSGKCSRRDIASLQQAGIIRSHVSIRVCVLSDFDILAPRVVYCESMVILPDCDEVRIMLRSASAV